MKKNGTKRFLISPFPLGRQPRVVEFPSPMLAFACALLSKSAGKNSYGSFPVELAPGEAHRKQVLVQVHLHFSGKWTSSRPVLIIVQFIPFLGIGGHNSPTADKSLSDVQSRLPIHRASAELLSGGY